MPKKKATNMDGIKSTPRQPESVPHTPEIPIATPNESGKLEDPHTPELEPITVVIELPLGVVGKKEYLSRHVESRLKTQDQQSAMKRLLRGLQASGATTNDGRPVQRIGDTIRWLMEQIASETDAIIHCIDLPGGTVAGTADLAEQL